MSVTPERLVEIEAELAELYKKKSGANGVNNSYGPGGLLPADFRKIHFDNEDQDGNWTIVVVNDESEKSFRLDREAFESLISVMQSEIANIISSYQTQIDALETEKNAP